MALILVFAAIGVAVAVTFASASASANPLGVADVLHGLGYDATQEVLAAAPFAGEANALAAVIVGTLLPGLVCVLLAEAVVAGVALRRAASLTLVLAAVCSVVVLPTPRAVAVGCAALVVGALLWVAGQLLLAPVSFVIGYLAAGYALSVLGRADDSLAGYADELGALVGVVPAWPPLLAALAVAPVIGAGARMLRR